MATSVPVLTNDTDVDDGPKIVNSVTQPANGTVVITGGGSGLTYSPNANYCNDGAPPDDTFAYTLSPGGSTATVSVAVTCVNDAPVADDETFNGADSVIGNTTLVGDDPSDGAPNSSGPKKSITGDILNGDTDVDGPNQLSVQAGTFTTNDGGSVTIESDGDFVYTPAAGTSCTDTSDFFDYTITDGNSPTAGTDSGAVTVSISGCVWYVNNNDPGNSGASTAPFDTLAQAQTASGIGHSIFVFDGDDTTTGYGAGIDLKANQKLIGEAATLTVGADTLHTGDPSKRPTITDSNADVVALDDANEARGLELDPSGTGGGIAGATGDTGGGTINDVRIIDNGAAGTQPGLDLDATTGTFDISNLTVSTNGAIGVRLLNAGTTNFASTGTISITSSGVRGLQATLTNMGANSVFDDITVTGSGTGGVSLSSTTGTTQLGDGIGADLDLTTSSGSNAGLLLPNAGTISVPGGGTANVSATGGPAVDINGTSTNATGFNFDDVDSTNSSGDGINIAGLGAGSFSANSNSSISNATVIDFDLDGGSGAITYDGTISDDAGQLVRVNNTTGGTKDFNGNITDGNDTDGGGISLTSNTGATVRFDGGLTLSTGSNAAFSATGGGTVAVTDPAGATDNTITTTTGTALNVANTNIHGDDLTFRSISANGATNGIVLNNTGTSGGLTMAGNGGACTIADPTCSGGTIQNTTGDGISLTNTRDVSLSNMRIKDTGSHGIAGTTVTNFTLSNSIVESPGNADDENGIYFATANSNNLSGTATFQNVAVTGMEENGLYISNSSGALGLTVAGSSFSNSVREDGILLETFGTLTLTALVQNSTFSGLASDGIKANANAGTLNVTAQGNTFTGCSVGCFSNPSDNAISFVSGGSATMKYTIGGTASGTGNTLNNSHNSAMILQANDTSNMDGRVLNNTITNTTNGNGIDGSLAADDDSRAKLLIEGNTISGQRQGAMFFNANNTGDLDVTLLGNTMNSRPVDTTAFENLTVSANGTSIACTNIRNNSVAQGGADAFGSGVPADAFRLDDDDPPDPDTTLKLERGNSASNDPKQVVRDNNPTSVSNTVSTSATITLVPNNTCALPATTPTP